LNNYSWRARCQNKVPRAWAYQLKRNQQIFNFSNEDPDFYIQLKGLNAGKPLQDPICNSIGIIANKEIMDPRFLYYTVLYIFNTGNFKVFLRGSVIPYIRQPDIKFVIYNHFIQMARQMPKKTPKAWVK
jgi:hypothetical protein